MAHTHLFHLSLEEAGCFIKNCLEQSITNLLKNSPWLTNESQALSTAEDVLSVAKLCEFLQISRPTCNQWMKSGKLPYRRMGRRVYFVKQDVLASLQSFNRRAK